MHRIIFTLILPLLPGCWTVVETLTGKICTYCQAGQTITVTCIGG